MAKYKIGIIGSKGMVGGALKKYFTQKPHYELFLYDIAGEGSVEEVNRADYIYICVPTPSGNSNECDTNIVDSAVGLLRGNKVVIIKSTVIPGTTQKLQDKYQQHKFLFNPEFLTEVTADNDTQFPDRQIVGYTKQSFTTAKDIIQQLPLAPFERIVKSEEAEMCKYFGNTWFSTKVIFANQMYDICEKAKINYEAVKDMVAADKRIGRTHLDIFHKGNRGYGGKCLPKDTKALIYFSEELGIDPKLLKVVEEINNKELKCKK
jgi:UDPglucose 6-dehydrogenase